jgi:hypothetical protein
MAQTVLDSKGWKVGGVREGKWTLFGDTVTAEAEGITTKPGLINTLPGDDAINGTLEADLDGKNPDADNNLLAGVLINKQTILNLGLGDDSITGNGPSDNPDASGIRNEGILFTGPGKDSLEGNGYNGIFNARLAVISMGLGADTITGTGPGYGLFNEGVITMDAGDDFINGSGSEQGIHNDGTILMGDGADTVDALIGNTPAGFSGDGLIDCGRGNDVVKGFGNGTFRGGAGTDALVLQDGIYTVMADGANFTITATDLETPANVAPGTMTINSFEKIGGINDTLFTDFLNITAETFKVENGNISVV